jgi:hypothetical protein
MENSPAFETRVHDREIKRWVVRCFAFGDGSLQVLVDKNGARAWLWWKAHHRRMTAVFMPPPMSGWQQHARCLKPDFVTIGRFRVSDVNSQKPCFPFPLIKEIYTQQAEAVLYSRRSSTVRRATDPDSAQDFTKRSAKHNSFLAPGTNGWSTQGWLAL